MRRRRNTSRRRRRRSNGQLADCVQVGMHGRNRVASTSGVSAGAPGVAAHEAWCRYRCSATGLVKCAVIDAVTDKRAARGLCVAQWRGGGTRCTPRTPLHMLVWCACGPREWRDVVRPSPSPTRLCTLHVASCMAPGRGRC